MSYKQEKLNVPVINIAALIVPGSKSEDVAATVAAIGSACREWGFFYIVGHQLHPNFIQDVQRLSRQFFQKPKEFKRNVARTAVSQLIHIKIQLLNVEIMKL